MSLKDKI